MTFNEDLKVAIAINVVFTYIGAHPQYLTLMYNLARGMHFLYHTRTIFDNFLGENKILIPLASLVYVFDTFYSMNKVGGRGKQCLEREGNDFHS